MRFFERGIARIENRWQDSGETGERFIDPHHPYSADLDLFGKASLFHLLSTARTSGGEDRLASWLKVPASVEELRERHAAVAELRPMIDLREQLAVLGDEYRAGVDPDRLAHWAGAPAHPFSMLQRVSSSILAIAAAMVLLWWFGTGFVDIPARRAIVAMVVIESSFIFSIRKRIAAVVGEIGEPARDLDLLSQILAALEAQTFESNRRA